VLGLLNLGDIIAEDGDIHGEGVNIASRLEGIAEPGSSLQAYGACRRHGTALS
jgi:class 3 adenylate cyclase